MFFSLKRFRATSLTTERIIIKVSNFSLRLKFWPTAKRTDKSLFRLYSGNVHCIYEMSSLFQELLFSEFKIQFIFLYFLDPKFWLLWMLFSGCRGTNMYKRITA